MSFNFILDASIFVTMGFGVGFIAGGLAAHLTDCWSTGKQRKNSNPQPEPVVSEPEVQPVPDPWSLPMPEPSVYQRLPSVIPTYGSEIFQLTGFSPVALLPAAKSKPKAKKSSLLDSEPMITHEAVNAVAAMLDALPPKQQQPVVDLTTVDLDAMTDEELRTYAYTRGVSKRYKKRSTILEKLQQLS